MKIEIKAYYGSLTVVSGAIIVHRFPEKDHPVIEKVANIAKERLKGLIKDPDPQIRVEVMQKTKFTYIFGGDLNSPLENLQASGFSKSDSYMHFSDTDNTLLPRLKAKKKINKDC